MIKGLERIMQSTGDTLFARRVRVKTEPTSWIGLDVAQVPFTGNHIAVVTASDKGDMLANEYQRRKRKKVVGRRLVFSRGNAEEKALERAGDIADTLRGVARRPIFNIPLPAGTFPTPEDLKLEE